MAESGLGWPRPLVLVVEDHPLNYLLAQEALERSNFRILGARSAKGAKEVLQEHQPDLILMDIQLPDQDGLSFTRELKADPLTAAIPIVALTARAMPEDERAAMDAGCAAYMTKPIDFKTFGATLTAVLDKVHRQYQ